MGGTARELAGKRVLVTGAGSGLGAAIAARLVSEGARVLFTDVVEASAEASANVAGGAPGAFALRLDVTSDEQWAAARDWCERTWGGLDILVNNAGVAAAGDVEANEVADWQWILDTNLLSCVRGCRTFLPQLKQQGSGRIVNVASLAGIVSMPGMAAYNVTKAGVISLSETLRGELSGTGVGVTVVCPSFVQTNLAASMVTTDPFLVESTKHVLAESKLTPDDVAEQVLQAIVSDRFLVLTEPAGRIMWRLKRAAPGLTARALVVGLRMRRKQLAKQQAHLT